MECTLRTLVQVGGEEAESGNTFSPVLAMMGNRIRNVIIVISKESLSKSDSDLS